MTSISTAYSTTQLTYSVSQISADTQSALNTTSSNLAAGLALGANQQETFIKKAQELLALARTLNAASLTSKGGVSLLGTDSEAAAATALNLQTMLGVTDLPTQRTLAFQQSSYDGTVTVSWITPTDVQILGSQGYDNYTFGDPIPQQFRPQIPADALMCADSGDNTREYILCRDPSGETATWVIPNVTNRLVTPDQLIDWANSAIKKATAFTPQLESGNAVLIGQLKTYAEMAGESFDLQKLADRFLGNRADSQLQVNTDYDTAVREVSSAPRGLNTKPA